MANIIALPIRGEQPAMSLTLPDGQSFEDWEETGRNLSTANKVLSWWIGDWWAAGSHRYGARAQTAGEGIFGREFQTLMNLASVCRAFETSRRREGLSFTHHSEVASLPPQKADRLLDRAEAEGWSVKDLRAEAIISRESTSRWFEPKSPPTRFDREQAKEAIFQCLSEAADKGEICPTADDLAEVSGVASISTTVALMHSLEDDGRIKVERFQKSRQVMIVRTGQATAEPRDKTPHWRELVSETPAPSVEAIKHRAPTIALEIFAAARALGKTPQDYLTDLVLLGWEVETMRRDSLGISNAA
jgi:hypothetical protein